MWAQKKRHGNNFGNGDGFSLQKAIPKTKGTSDIDDLLAQSKLNDELEQEQDRQESQEKDRCGCF